MSGILIQTREEYSKRVMPAGLISLAGLFLVLLTLMYSLRPAVLNGFLEGAGSPYALIEAYDKWYGILTVTRVVCWAIAVVCCVAAVAIGWRTLDAVFVAVFFSLFGLWLCDTMYFSEDIPKLREMAQIADDRLETVEVYLHEKTVRKNLPGSYAKGQQESFILYRGIGEATNHNWESFYVPEILDFTPDAGKMYNEQRSVDWNEENAQVYYITYTTNFRVVVS
ncbi:MAG: hypothetical protein K2K96_07835 [Lachnospiraceae bacterium]|nr:hypothetical protein [Lachnospiraceae bacterium]